ncbi:YgiQ family radical SAM protein [Ghiorsea bivora]|uniref:YgiQ family radical SAM protein n=1 Tax=Ghiorsea bivora TaxID=1485545 RepID=UPI00056EC05D|nr:YgiQ family radical SAM protein [Ghiorsea bivora]
MHSTPRSILSYPKYWAAAHEKPAFQLPMCKADMDKLGWDSCDIILVTGDAYVDLPSFGMAVVGRALEAQGFRVGIIAQPNWKSADEFRALGKPNLFWGVTAGNMDSMVNRYTSERKIRSDDAYTVGDVGGKRPDRAVTVYAQRVREAFKGVPVVIGGIEASLRRIAHYDYWSDKVRRSVLMDSKADILVYGNGERQIIEIAHALGAGKNIKDLKHIRGTAVMMNQVPDGWIEIPSTDVDEVGQPFQHPNPYAMTGADKACDEKQLHRVREQVQPVSILDIKQHRNTTVIRMPSYEALVDDEILYAHASRLLHLETNPGNARALIQQHGNREVWINPPAIPLTTEELDSVFDLPYSRLPYMGYGDIKAKESKIPAYEMIKNSVNIMRGCFGGCTFCSITEHEGRIIQSRSEKSVLKEVEAIRDKTPNFTGVISDLGGPTANMYRLKCKSAEIEASCRKPSCVFPGICKNLGTDHNPLIQLYRKTRNLKGIKRVFIASGLRYDLAVESPEYIKELVTHHVGGYLKIAPEHTENAPLDKMMKPGIGSYDKFKTLFEKYSKEVGKKQYLIPYFIAAHPGTTDEDMLNLALWLKQNNYKADQVQAFLPSPMSTAAAMYRSGRNPLKAISRVKPRYKEEVFVPKRKKQRDLHKAFLRYHDKDNWPMLRDALKKMGRADLIGSGEHQLIPAYQSAPLKQGSRKQGISFRTQHSRAERKPKQHQSRHRKRK